MKHQKSVTCALCLAALWILASCASTPPRDPAVLHAENARSAARARDFERAEKEAKLALQRNPLDANSHFLLSTLLARRGEVDQAAVGYQRVLTLDPNHATALYNLGTLLLRRSEPGAAAEVLERAAELRPEHAATLNNLGKAYFLIGVPELAGSAFEEALARDPANETALANLAVLAEGAGASERAAEYRQRLAAIRAAGAIR